MLSSWTAKGFIQRRTATYRQRFEYRRMVELPPDALTSINKPAGLTARRVDPDWTGSRRATKEHLAAWREQCAKVASLTAMFVAMMEAKKR